ncbi:MAG: hypothetical protein HYX79_06420 [Chloroflexi bacterium]|nr:hypothetical protein [Chloroflexota bacterium]
MEWEATMIDIRDSGKAADFENRQIFQINNVEIKDHKTLERIYVKAQFSRDPAKLPEGDVLWVKDYDESIIPEPMRIKILEKLPNPVEKYL